MHWRNSKVKSVKVKSQDVFTFDFYTFNFNFPFTGQTIKLPLLQFHISLQQEAFNLADFNLTHEKGLRASNNFVPSISVCGGSNGLCPLQKKIFYQQVKWCDYA
jgi:hypothetical protein